MHFPHIPGNPTTGAPGWPQLSGRPVEVGGVTVTYAAVLEASALLATSRTSAIAPVLAAARSPLAACDYLGVAAPFLAMARALPKTGRCGAAGRHVTKTAFLAGLAARIGQAEAAELATAEAAFGTDERYAAAMATEAVAIRERAHAAALRARVRSAVDGAVAACAADPFSACVLETACGTGQCRFAPAELAPYELPASPGRTARPAGHTRAGKGFSAAAVATALAEDTPYRVGVPVSDSDHCTGRDAEVA